MPRNQLKGQSKKGCCCVLMVFWAGNAGLSTTLWNHNAEIQWALWELSVDCDENRELLVFNGSSTGSLKSGNGR